MSLDVHWTLTVQIPQLDTLQQTLVELGGKLVETVESIIAHVERLNTQQAASAQALTEQVTIIANEVAEWDAASITQQQIDNLGTALKTAADTAEQQVANIRANTDAIKAIVPDTPA